MLSMVRSGLFGKSVIDEAVLSRQAAAAGTVPSDAMDLSRSDAVLLAVTALLLIVGSFATQVAAGTWEEIRTEMDALREAKQGQTGSENREEMGILEMLAIEESEVRSCKLLLLQRYQYASIFAQLPKPIRAINDELKGASKRLKTVISDEVRFRLQTCNSTELPLILFISGG